jgi:hypothetical protein
MKRFVTRGHWAWLAVLALGAAAPCVRADASYSTVILSDAPVGYYRLGDPGTQVAATDASGNGRDGIYSRGVVGDVAGAIVGDTDTAAQFDGSTAYVNVINDASNTGAFTLRNSFSLEAWVINGGQAVVNPSRSPLGRIVSNGWPGNIGYGWGILGDNGMRFTTYGIFDYDSHQSQVPQDGSWHYVAVVFDGSNTANFYIDGVLTDAISASRPANLAALDLMIGRNPASTAEEFFNGSIDEVAIYNYELSDLQILAHFQVAH